MISILHQAIRDKRVVKINYEGYERIVEPHLVGRKRNRECWIKCLANQGIQ